MLESSLDIPEKAKDHRSAKYTFDFRARSDIPAGGIVELEFPSQYNLSLAGVSITTPHFRDLDSNNPLTIVFVND